MAMDLVPPQSASANRHALWTGLAEETNRKPDIRCELDEARRNSPELIESVTNSYPAQLINYQRAPWLMRDAVILLNLSI